MEVEAHSPEVEVPARANLSNCPSRLVKEHPGHKPASGTLSHPPPCLQPPNRQEADIDSSLILGHEPHINVCLLSLM